MSGIRLIEGGVTSARGFRAAGVEAGIKKSGRDMAMICSDVPCRAAGTFTSNLVKAAPVKWDREIIAKYGCAQAVVVNSGVANACTGEEGIRACQKTAEKASMAAGIDPRLVLTASTGVIGRNLPLDKILAGIDLLAGKLSDTPEAGTEAALAIMTTDTVRKEAAVTFEIGGKTVTIGGMTKGSGMIHPNMCTMLAFLCTDVNISVELLQKALSESVVWTYNMISVDGDTSTNDTCLLLANGLADNPEINEENGDYRTFCEALNLLNRTLARRMAADGEGATALIEAVVENAASLEQARVLSKSIICSNLVKTAIAGHDANWGRVLCAMGYSGAEFDPENTDLYFESAAGRIQILKKGIDTGYSEEEATRILSEKEIRIIADIHGGDQTATAWGCDLTHEYITINADYRS